MAKYRRDRINEEMTREVSDIVRGIKDPRVAKHLVSVIRCEVTPDLKYCKIFYSVLGADREGDGFDAKELKKGLISAAGYIRGQIAERLNLRITPELQFVYDNSIAYGARINTILHTPSVKDDIRRFDERAEQQAREAALAAQSQNEPNTATEEDEYDD